MFARSSIDLRLWFYTILHFCNSGNGLTTDNLAIHLGISHKSAYRMAMRIRMHLGALDEERRLGGTGQIVYVCEDKLANIQAIDGGTRAPLRIVALYDGEDFSVVPVPKGRFAASNTAIMRRIHPGSTIHFRSIETIRKMSRHRRKTRLVTDKWSLADPAAPQIALLAEMLTALKAFIPSSHIWVRADHIEHYISHFQFTYRHRAVGHSAFWDAISRFPDIDRHARGR